MNRLMKLGLLLVALVAMVTMAGCRSAEIGQIINGWEIGDPVDCTDFPECDLFIPAAIEGFARRDPGHLSIIHVRLHHHGFVLGTCSGGCPVVAVFHLADGSIRAIGVGTPGIRTTPETSTTARTSCSPSTYSNDRG